METFSIPNFDQNPVAKWVFWSGGYSVCVLAIPIRLCSDTHFRVSRHWHLPPLFFGHEWQLHPLSLPLICLYAHLVMPKRMLARMMYTMMSCVFMLPRWNVVDLFCRCKFTALFLLGQYSFGGNLHIVLYICDGLVWLNRYFFLTLHAFCKGRYGRFL